MGMLEMLRVDRPPHTRQQAEKDFLGGLTGGGGALSHSQKAIEFCRSKHPSTCREVVHPTASRQTHRGWKQERKRTEKRQRANECDTVRQNLKRAYKKGGRKTMEKHKSGKWTQKRCWHWTGLIRFIYKSNFMKITRQLLRPCNSDVKSEGM